jgi:hypothetical protein
MRIPRLQRHLAPTPTVGLLLTTVLLLAAPARAEDVGHKIIRLCATGKSLAGYPPSAYAKALKEISATTEEYSECGQLIRAAQAAAAQGNGSGSAGAGAPLPQAVAATPAEQKSIAAAAANGGGPVSLGGQEVHPGVVHANVASAFSTLPAPLLALIAFLLACMLAFAGRFIRDRTRGGRTD